MSDITIKIHQGTGHLTGESLCKSCSFATCLEDRRGEHVYCNQVPFGNLQIKGKVLTCNRYYNRNLPTLNDLYQTAWTLRTEKNGKMIGFKPPESSAYPSPAMRVETKE